MEKECKHPTCENKCRRPKKVKKIYHLKRSPLKKSKPKPVKRSQSTIPEMLELAQMVFNRWIRERDKDKTCISSGIWEPVFQAGHLYPAGSFSGVRFNELNVNGQTVEENCFKDGNVKYYRIGLIDRYGEKAVLELDELAKSTRFYKWSRDELQQIINKYKLKK